MIQLRLDPRQAAPARYYRVAGRQLAADRELEWLAPFTVEGEAAWLQAVEPPEASGPAETLFAGNAFLARRDRFLICRRSAEAFHFEVEELGELRYRPAESLLEVVAAGAEEKLLAEVLLGPLLALALADRGVFLLHASGCELDGASWLMLGESGAGKSTLAASLGGFRLADDQAAVGAEGRELLPDFPQPKMSEALQVPLAKAGPRTLRGLLLLDKAPPGTEPALVPLPSIEAAAGILRHTTAALCFDQELLRRHLDFAAGLAARVPCFRLRYPHHPAVFETIRALLA